MIALIAAKSEASIDAFVIRGTPIIDESVPGQVEFIIDNSGDKAGWGTTALDGSKVGQIAKLAVTRLDDYTRFAAGSGPYVAPYFNIWITDGANYAVIANEPSDPSFQTLFNSGTYDLDWSDIAGKVAKVYENNDKSWLPNNGVGLTFGDLANFTIMAPTPAQLALGWAGLGTGAPRELGTNVAYGFNWVFGDTLSNYVSGDDGYIVGSFAAQSAVPEPFTLLTWGGLIGCALVASRRSQRT